MIQLFDSHAHLGSKDFALDASEVVKRSLAAGVLHIANCADELAEFAPTLALKRDYPKICLCCLGIHPEFAGRGKDYFEKAIKEIRKSISEVDAIGEVGLDYHFSSNEREREQQRYLFGLMCDLAVEYDKPIVVHAREALDDALKILTEKKVKAIDFHCFEGDMDFAKKAMALSDQVYFGANGILTFKSAKKVKEVFSALPLDRVLLETDSPELAPVPFRGKRNEPKNLVYISQTLSDLRFEDLAPITAQVYRNAMRFFHVSD